MSHDNKRAFEKPLVEVATWLEHMETEMEPVCRASEVEDFELLLKNSPKDFETLESLKRVRVLVKKSDDVALPESGHYYDQLHSKIMAAIEADAALEPLRPAKRSMGAGLLAWPTLFRASGVTMMVALVAWVGLNQKSTFSKSDDHVAAHNAAVGENFGRSVASVDAHAGATFARDMGSFETEEDFVTEAAEERLQQISQHDAEAMIRSLKM